MIKQFKYDTKNNTFTDEVEEISLYEYIQFSCNRIYDWKINYIYKDWLIDFAQKNNIECSGLKRDIVHQIYYALSADGTANEDIYDFCDSFGIGVTKYHYLASGMTEKDYKRLYKKLTVVSTETIRGNQHKNLYSIRQYHEYLKTGVV